MTRRPDTLYRAYITLLLLALVIAPALYTLVTSLGSRPLVTLLAHERFPVFVVAFTGLMLTLALAAGTTRGPVLMSPFQVHVVAGGPQRRRTSLRSPFLSALVLLIPTGAVLGAVLHTAVLRVDGSIGGNTFVPGVLAGAVIGMLLGVAWLAGQSLSRRTTQWASAISLSLTLVVVLRWPGQLSLSGWVVLTGGAVCLLAAVPALLDRLRGPVLLEQAHRWHDATSAGATGDLATAVGMYRARARRPRPARAIGSTPGLPVLFLRRDVIGSARTPLRSLVGGAALGVAVLLGTWATTLPGEMTWAIVAVTSALGYLALGVWSDGFRHAVEAAAAPSLYGVSDSHLMGLHAILPVVLVLTLGTIAIFLTLQLGGQPLMGLLTTIGLLFAIAVRMFDAAKGPIPPHLLTPVPTPMGDASAIPLALWQVDALLVAALVPTGVSAAALTHGGSLLLAYVPATAAVLLALRHRLLSP